MNIRIEGYDEYVKDFEEVRNTTDVLPETEEEILEFVAEYLEKFEVIRIEDYEKYAHRLKAENSIDGREHEFCFMFGADDDKQIVLCYQPEG